MAIKVDKVVLLIPNSRWTKSRYWRINPYSICLVAASVRDRRDVIILDANLENLSMEQVAKCVSDHNPQILGIHCISIEYAKSIHDAVAIIKKWSPGVTVVLGGVYPTSLPEVAMNDQNIDYVVLSEGEIRFSRLLDALEKDKTDIKKIEGLAYRSDEKVVVNPVTDFIGDLDSIPFPAYDLVDFSAYSLNSGKYDIYNNPVHTPYAVTVSSRGCPFHCFFCANKPLSGEKIRYRSAKNVLQEIDWLIQEYGIREITFLDDNLLLNKRRILDIMQGIKERGITWRALTIPVFAMDDEMLEMIKASGCDRVILPIESGNQYVLDKIVNKPLKLDKARRVIAKAKELNLTIMCGFVIGMPGETWDNIRDTFKFAEEIDVDYVVFSIATPLPGAPMTEVAKEKGYLEPGFDFANFEFFGFGHGSITTEEFTPTELQIVRAFEWDRINFKSKEKALKIAEMNCITMEELNEWRKSTRRNCGMFCVPVK